MYQDWENVQGVRMESFSRQLREQAYKKPLTERISPNWVLSEAEVSWFVIGQQIRVKFRITIYENAYYY